jgi:hypothetical protein
MSRRSEAYLQGIPSKPYDLLREGLCVLLLWTVVIVILAAFLGSPDYPAVRGEDVAQRQPLLFLKTGADILAGGSSLQDYGPPYSPDTGNAQRFLGVAPADWAGVRRPIDPPRDFILRPLARVAILNPAVGDALRTYQAAGSSQQQAWMKAYLAALAKAKVVAGQVQLPAAEYGPVPVLMTGLLDLGRAGLLEGALADAARLPFTLDFTRALLFFQDDVDHSVARSLDMLGRDWGVSHETGPYPGAWWLWPYAFFYQIPPMSTSPNGDLQVGLILLLVFLGTVFAPFVPILNRLPRWLGVYRWIWRDWYRQQAWLPAEERRGARSGRKGVPG